MDRFLRYSLEHRKAIRLIFIDPEGKMRQASCVVEGMEDGKVSLYMLRPLRRMTVPREDVLGASYAPGDEGNG